MPVIANEFVSIFALGLIPSFEIPLVQAGTPVPYPIELGGTSSKRFACGSFSVPTNVLVINWEPKIWVNVYENWILVLFRKSLVKNFQKLQFAILDPLSTFFNKIPPVEPVPETLTVQLASIPTLPALNVLQLHVLFVFTSDSVVFTFLITC